MLTKLDVYYRQDFLAMNAQYQNVKPSNLIGPMQSLTEMTLCTTMTCFICGHQTSLTVKERMIVVPLHASQVETIEDCIEFIEKDEVIDEKKCEKCHLECKSGRTTKILKYPVLLLISLQRMYSKKDCIVCEGQSLERIQSCYHPYKKERRIVDTPINFSLKTVSDPRFEKTSIKYHHTGTVLHEGLDARCGHFQAIVTHLGCQRLCYNDDRKTYCTARDSDEELGRIGYLHLYEMSKETLQGQTGFTNL